MARITEFFNDVGNSQVHPTTVECGWQVIQSEEGNILQLSTYGSDSRASKKKVSQTIQLDSRIAQELREILNSAFGE